jgi:hypothetical protein
VGQLPVPGWRHRHQHTGQIDPGATYIVAGRQPLDSAISLCHQAGNINQARQRELAAQFTGQPLPAETDTPPKPAGQWLRDWIDSDASPHQQMDSIRGVLWHNAEAWARRAEPNIVLLHYADLSADLGGQMRQLAARLGITVPEGTWPALIEAAAYSSMRAAAEQIIGPSQILKRPAGFFRRGVSGSGRESLTAAELAHYYTRAAELAPPDMLAWLHRPVG